MSKPNTLQGIVMILLSAIIIALLMIPIAILIS